MTFNDNKLSPNNWIALFGENENDILAVGDLETGRIVLLKPEKIKEEPLLLIFRFAAKETKNWYLCATMQTGYPVPGMETLCRNSDGAVITTGSTKRKVVTIAKMGVFSESELLKLYYWKTMESWKI